jgi:hypothetical protein
MDKQVDERRVIERMDKAPNKWDGDTGYSVWKYALLLAVFLLAVGLAILWMGGTK